MVPQRPMFTMPNASGLLADLYELTMAAGYIETRFEARATFELFVRSSEVSFDGISSAIWYQLVTSLSIFDYSSAVNGLAGSSSSARLAIASQTECS